MGLIPTCGRGEHDESGKPTSGGDRRVRSRLRISAYAQSGETTVRDDPSRPSIDVAIALDTSSSMEGLIATTRLKLWEIDNDLALAQPAPRLRVALLSYGNSGYDPREGFVRLETSLTTGPPTRIPNSISAPSPMRPSAEASRVSASTSSPPTARTRRRTSPCETPCRCLLAERLLDIGLEPVVRFRPANEDQPLDLLRILGVALGQEEARSTGDAHRLRDRDVGADRFGMLAGGQAGVELRGILPRSRTTR